MEQHVKVLGVLYIGVYGLWVLLSRETETLFASPPPSSLAR
jgi:hypothetical protein